MMHPVIELISVYKISLIVHIRDIGILGITLYCPCLKLIVAVKLKWWNAAAMGVFGIHSPKDHRTEESSKIIFFLLSN